MSSKRKHEVIPAVIDVTSQAKKLFEAIVELEAHFGLFYTIDVIKGSEAMYIRPHHKNLHCYGGGRELTRSEWIELGTQLIFQGFLERRAGMYPTISLTGAAWAVIRGERNVFATRPSPAFYPSVHVPLYALLRELRDRLARDAKTPPYMIVPERTLLELATTLPSTTEGLQNISGFGKVRVAKFGDQFVTLIKSYLQSNNIVTAEPGSQPIEISREQTFELFASGLSATAIAQQLNVPLDTIESHLAHYVGVGQVLLEQVMSPDNAMAIRRAIALVGSESIDAILEITGTNVSRSEVRYVIAQMRNDVSEAWESDRWFDIEESTVFVLD